MAHLWTSLNRVSVDIPMQQHQCFIESMTRKHYSGESGCAAGGVYSWRFGTRNRRTVFDFRSIWLHSLSHKYPSEWYEYISTQQLLVK